MVYIYIYIYICIHIYIYIYTHTQWNTTQSFLKNDILPFETTWMELEDIMLSEISQRERQILHDFTYIWNLKNKKTKQNKTHRYRVVVSREEGAWVWVK